MQRHLGVAQSDRLSNRFVMCMVSSGGIFGTSQEKTGRILHIQQLTTRCWGLGWERQRATSSASGLRTHSTDAHDAITRRDLSHEWRFNPCSTKATGTTSVLNRQYQRSTDAVKEGKPVRQVWRRTTTTRQPPVHDRRSSIGESLLL
jgi:hypothetical protein